MKVYWLIAKATWQEYLSYRLNFLLEVIGGVFAMLIAMAVWHSIYSGESQEVIGSYSLEEIITYLLGVGIISSLLFLTGQGDDINDDINRGTLSHHLLKPINVSLYWATRDLVRKVFTLTLGIIGFLAIFLFCRDFIVGPMSPLSLLFFSFAIFLAMILHFLLFYCFSAIAFWLEETWGWRFVIRIIMEIAAGVLIPIALFPEFWRTIFEFLPLQYLLYFPMQIYLGKITGLPLLCGFAKMTGWIILLIAFALYIWRRGIKHYTAHGG